MLFLLLVPSWPLSYKYFSLDTVLTKHVIHDKTKREKKIIAVVRKYAYTQYPGAVDLKIHCSTTSNSVREKA